jgi:hypothetical protein
MKQILGVIAFVLVLLAIFAGITGPLHAKGKQEEPSKNLSTGEIKVLCKETLYYRSMPERDIVSVLQYEGHKYLFNHNGGILHAESCPCKTAVQEEK